MIRSANHSGYPRAGEHPLDRQANEDETLSVVVAEQSRAFLDVVTDGLVRWSGPFSHYARHLDGIRSTELVRWFGFPFYDERPEVIGPVRRRRPFLVHDFEVASAVGPKALKMALTGPVTFGRVCRDLHYGNLEVLARDLARALAEEVADLAAAGCRIVQIDEPVLCRRPSDADLVAETAATIFSAAGEGSTTILSTYLGSLDALGNGASDLPGTHLGLDLVTGGDGNLDVLRRLPAGRGVALGVFDATTTRLEDAADVAGRLEPLRDLLVGRDVVVGPQLTLELLPRHEAFDKLLHARYLAETLSREWPWA